MSKDMTETHYMFNIIANEMKNNNNESKNTTDTKSHNSNRSNNSNKSKTHSNKSGISIKSFKSNKSHGSIKSIKSIHSTTLLSDKHIAPKCKNIPNVTQFIPILQNTLLTQNTIPPKPLIRPDNEEVIRQTRILSFKICDLKMKGYRLSK